MFEALLIGIIAAVPVGPVLLMIIQKTLTLGKREGVSAGIGSALADTVYAAVGLFTLSLIEDFIDAHQALIMFAGAAILGFIGIKILIKKIDFEVKPSSASLSIASHGLQTFTSAMSNPAALAFMLGLIATFDLGGEMLKAPIWALLLAVFIGETLYWIFVVFVLSRFVKLKPRVLQIVSRIAGAGICIFAIMLLVKGVNILIV